MAKSDDMREKAAALRKQAKQLSEEARKQKRKEEREAARIERERQQREALTLGLFAKQATMKVNGERVSVYDYLLAEYERSKYSGELSERSEQKGEPVRLGM